MKKTILPLSKLNKEDVGIAGGKGAILGELIRRKVNVPKGFVITSIYFDDFLAENNIKAEIDAQLERINYRSVNSVDRASNVIRDLIADSRFSARMEKEIMGELGKLNAASVAVRSSATAEDSGQASWAGELESFLNTESSDLVATVKKCWSSLFTPRAIFYRNEQGLIKSDISVAVVVQEMIEADVSGICFTVHPVTCDNNQMIIEAGYGLGEAVVGGQITPDNYIIDKRNFSIMEKNIATQKKMVKKKSGKVSGTRFVAVPASKQKAQKLSESEMIELANICARIEKVLKYPCDIEWAIYRGKIYITQARPITTLAVHMPI